MPVAKLLELAQSESYDQFEATCLEMLEAGHLTLKQLVRPFEELDRKATSDRLATLTQMVLDSVDVDSDPQAALALARIALIGSPSSEDLRRITIDLYRRIYGHAIRFNAVLESSGIDGGRPIRHALKLLDLCLTLQPGDTLISRMDDRVVEVTDIDREHGLFTLRQQGRATTRPGPEVVREFDRIAADDFRVLRQLRPERLAELIREDPVTVVVGLIHAHGEQLDNELLKHELVPKYIETREWARWWSAARSKLKRSPHVIMEGRSPIVLRYTAEERTLEDETWEKLEGQSEPADWLTTAEKYLREKTARKETPDAGLLERFRRHVMQYVAAVRRRRPGDALACTLLLDRLEEKGLSPTGEAQAIATEIVRETREPARLLAGIEHEGLRERGLHVLQAARPDDWAGYAIEWLPTAPAGLLDELAGGAIDAGRGDDIQRFIDVGLDDLPGHPELLFWLWKGPKCKKSLRLPSDDELFRMILDTLSSLGRTMSAEPAVVRRFRLRMKAALTLRSYAKARHCLEQTSGAAAITIRRQIQRLEGLGDNAPARMLNALRDAHPELWVERKRRLEPWEDPETLWTTAQGITKRTAERDEIVNVKMPENGRRIGEAASHGDLSENSEYKFALEERDLLRARLAKINDELSQARALSPHDVPENHSGIGSRVTLRRVHDGAEEVRTFLGPFDTDVERDVYSYLAPVSQKLMGRRIGERVTFAVDGVDVEFEVVALANALAVTTF